LQFNQAGKGQLAKIDGSTGGEAGTSKNFKEMNELAEASQTDPALQADIQPELKQAKKAVDKAKAEEDQAVADMFQLYANLLSADAKKVWEKIVQE
jgi:hypothetical protein